jgi:virulence-associated protein VagC
MEAQIVKVVLGTGGSKRVTIPKVVADLLRDRIYVLIKREDGRIVIEPFKITPISKKST